MSLVSETVENILALWKRDRKQGRRIAVLERRMLAAEARVEQAIAQAGDALYGAFTYPPPPMLVRIEEFVISFTYAARRLEDTPTGMVFDSEDDRLYQIRTRPWASSVFIGARGMAQHSHNTASLLPVDENALTSVYALRDGEWQGFNAVINGGPVTDGGGSVVYPWAQTGVLPGDAYTDTTQIMDDEGMPIGSPLGKAHLVTQAGWDESLPITITRKQLPVGTPVNMWYDTSTARFVMMQASEINLFDCDPA